MMPKEDYVNYEVAKLAAKKGFNWDCHSSFDPKGIVTGSDTLAYIEIHYKSIEDYLTSSNKTLFRGYVARPTKQMLKKWLRETYGIEIEVFCILGGGYNYTVFKGISESVLYNNKISGIYPQISLDCPVKCLNEALLKGLNKII